MDVGTTAHAESDHIDEMPGELWENHGWCLRLRGGGTEYLFWVAFYILRGQTGGRFTVQDVRIAQAIVVEWPTESADVLSDSPFHVSGVNWSEYAAASQLVVSTKSDVTTWSMSGREHTSAPPTWHIRGAAGPYQLDIELRALAPVSHFDGFELINGYEALARASGTVSDASGAHDVEGFGQHEKVHTAVPIQRKDGAGFLTLPIQRRHAWHCFASERFAMTLLANQPGESEDRINGHVIIDGASHSFTRSQLQLEETGQWLDPRSGVTVPSSWRVTVELSAGTLVVTVTAKARAYYLWDYIKGSTSLLYWFLCTGVAVWRPVEGPITQEDISYVAHTNRPFLYWG